MTIRCRYAIVFIQLVMACWMLGEATHIKQYHDNQDEDNQYRAPDNLIETAITVSAYVMVGAVGVAAVTIYLACDCKDQKEIVEKITPE